MNRKEFKRIHLVIRIQHKTLTFLMFMLLESLIGLIWTVDKSLFAISPEDVSKKFIVDADLNPGYQMALRCVSVSFVSRMT